jgi:tRNA-splicing ligase RtcB
MEWARQYADANRHAMAEQTAAMLQSICGVKPNWETLISIDHNHVRLESVDGQSLWIHRKGAMPAHAGLPGLIPGSMGTASFHVEGRGCVASLNSSAHGAGRTLRRERARQVISDRDLARQMEGVWYDFRASGSLRSDAPGAYKDVTLVLRAQRELTRTLRTLRPVLNYKGR